MYDFLKEQPLYGEMLETQTREAFGFSPSKTRPPKPVPYERCLKILRIGRDEFEDDPVLKETLTRFFDKRRRLPAVGQLKRYLAAKYNLPKGTEILEIVDTRSMMKNETDHVAVVKIKNKTFESIPNGELLPIFNPAAPATRRKGIIQI